MLRHLPETARDPNLLVGLDTSDDAGVYRLSDDVALVQSVDFFTPIVDDPRDFGRIAAANAMSDIYAMGGRPLTALNLVGFPITRLPAEVLGAILAGAAEKVTEAGAVIVGGHSIDDSEPKFGLAVTGIVHPDRVLANTGARPGDRLVLTKPIGTGIITTAIKRGLATPEETAEVTGVMAELNRAAAEAVAAVGVGPEGVHAATDVTGFGLLGHLSNVTRASCVGATVWAGAVPVLGPTRRHLAAGALPGGSRGNRRHLEEIGCVAFAPEVGEEDRTILCDAVTSGGLLIAVAPGAAGRLVAELEARRTPAAAVIGEVTADATGKIRVVTRA